MIHFLSCRALHEEDCCGAVGDLATISACGAIAVFWEGRADFAEGFVGGAPSRTLVFRQRHLFLFPRLGIFDGRGDGYDFVVEPARFLGALGSLVGFGCEAVLGFAGDVEVFADVFGGLAHGLHAVGCVLGGIHDFGVEGFGEAVAACGHHFGADGDAAFNVSEADLVGDVLGGFEAGGTEAVDGGGASGVGEASRECGGADFVGGSGVIDL